MGDILSAWQRILAYAEQRERPWSALISRQPALAFVLRTVLAVLLAVAAVACLAAIVLFTLISLFVMGLFIMAIHGIFLGLGMVKGWFVG